MMTYGVNTKKGQIQVKAKKEDAGRLGSAVRSLENIKQYQRELLGVKGVSESKSTSMQLIGNVVSELPDEAGYAAAMDAFYTKLLKAVIPSSMIDDFVKEAKTILNTYMVEFDHRETPDERAASEQQIADARARQSEAEMELVDRYCRDRERVDIPEGHTAVYVEMTYDDSDAMTDYFHRHHRYGPQMLLALVKKQAETERLARQVLDRYPDLGAHEWDWRTEKYSRGNGNYLESRGAAGVAEGVTTYGGYKNPGLAYEVTFGTRSTYMNKMYAYKTYPGVQAQAPAPAVASESAGDAPAFAVEHERDWTWVRFAEKPAREILDALKAAGARWGKARSAWYFTKRMEQTEVAALITA